MTVALAIAGSDSGGGAGIQADLEAFRARHVWGTTAITCVTAQNPAKVTRVEPVAPDMVVAQVAAVCRYFTVGAVKVGMLYSAPIIEAVADALGQFARGVPVVLDPVMVASSGTDLLAGDAVTALRDSLFPLASVVTPNLAEAACLVGDAKVVCRADMVVAAHRLATLTPGAVIITGGHLPDAAADLLLNRGQLAWLDGPRLETADSHGTGCSFSSALAAGLALGEPLAVAARKAKDYVFARLQGEAGKGVSRLQHDSDSGNKR
jgi:hydroxymethylpyrimidine/phosphomethylpyrimidine kinase